MCTVRQLAKQQQISSFFVPIAPVRQKAVDQLAHIDAAVIQLARRGYQLVPLFAGGDHIRHIGQPGQYPPAVFITQAALDLILCK
ncbi:hypothetical protein SDC9_109966 [bioreactor metagenome]|uniref:Uncharacterized protein n=1 Tax=bioreactor metagenome TaxID=1076179 RepID=A0A645BDB9_9ZZZZ